MSKFFCNGADAECSCPILCGDCKSADWTGGTEIKTNADHIRSMTDEELAEFLGDATYKDNEQGYPIMRTVNKVWWHKWLKQPYKEEV